LGSGNIPRPVKERYNMKSYSVVYVLLLLMVVSGNIVYGEMPKPNSSIFKDSLGIVGLDLGSIDVDGMIKRKVIDPAMQKDASAVVYILRGSIAPYAKHKSGSDTVYDERTVSTNTVFLAKEFLMNVTISHSNDKTRTMASVTMAYAFPNDDQISEWIFDQYFFGELNRRDTRNLIKIINFGRYSHPKAKAVIVDSMMRNEIEIFLEAIGCVRDNCDLYPEAYTILVPAMISFHERAWDIDDPSNSNIKNIAKTVLGSAVSRCKESKVFLSELAKFKGVEKKGAPIGGSAQTQNTLP
jgi:hypothetical protein